MRAMPFRLVVFLLALSVSLMSSAFVSAQLLQRQGVAAISSEISDARVCRPDSDCVWDCARKARHVYDDCIDVGRPTEDCRERMREVRRACITSECRPTLGCEDRCKAHAKHLLYRCLEKGGEMDVCRKEADSAAAACIEKYCRDCVCPDVYDPVCGIDGMTYGNVCEAHCAGVRVAHEGVCEPICKPLPCDFYCEFGHKLDRDGCPTCECNPPPGCQDDKDCGDGQICVEICPMRSCILGDSDCGECEGVCLQQPLD